MISREFIFNEYDKLIDGIFHYNDQQIDLKIICIKIVFGAFAFSGGLAFYDIGMTNFWLILTSSFLSIMALFAVTVILLNDLVYKEKLKMGFFIEAIKFEKEHPWLPEFHRSLIVKANVHGSRQASFYFGCAGFLIILAATSVAILPSVSSLLKALMVSVLVMIYVFYYILIKKFLEKLSRFELEKQEKKSEELFLEDIFLSRLHSKGKEYIEHFSKTKMRYKNLTISCVTAVFLAFVYIVALQETIVHINKIYLICFITFLSVIGLHLIRFLDVKAGHEQMRSIFTYLVDMERKTQNLSKPYDKIAQLLYKNNQDPVIFDFLYYTAISFGIIAFSILVLYAKVKDYHSKLGISIPIGFLCFFALYELLAFFQILKKRLKLKRKKT